MPVVLLTVGWVVNKPLLLFVTLKPRTWVKSGSPSLIAVAQVGTVCGVFVPEGRD